MGWCLAYTGSMSEPLPCVSGTTGHKWMGSSWQAKRRHQRHGVSQHLRAAQACCQSPPGLPATAKAAV